jgi:hypothetical protein
MGSSVAAEITSALRRTLAQQMFLFDCFTGTREGVAIGGSTTGY